MSPHSARLSPLDASFLDVETEAAHMHVGWAATFAPPENGYPRPSFFELRDHVASRLSRAPRYRQKLAGVPLGVNDPVWVDDDDFDISRHVRRAQSDSLEEIADEVMSSPARARPAAVGAVDLHATGRRARRDRGQGPPLHGRRARGRRARLAAARPHARDTPAAARRLVPRPPPEWQGAAGRRRARPRRGRDRARHSAAAPAAQPRPGGGLRGERRAQRACALPRHAAGAGQRAQRAHLPQAPARAHAALAGGPEAHQAPLRHDAQRRAARRELRRHAPLHERAPRGCHHAEDDGARERARRP